MKTGPTDFGSIDRITDIEYAEDLVMTLRAEVTSIKTQLERYHARVNSGGDADEDWRIGARAAMEHRKAQIARLERKVSRLSSKERRDAAKTNAVQNRSLIDAKRAAFMAAAREVLTEELYEHVWAIARTIRPEAFIVGSDIKQAAE